MRTPSAPIDLPGVLAGLLADPGRPRLTWYGPDGERVELSGHVLDNWVTKTANLLVEECDAGPGTTVAVDLPVHWRTVVWALATWRVGATVLLDEAARGADGTDADVVVTREPAGRRAVPNVVAITLPALARRFDGELPPGALDAATAVMTYGDVLSWAPTPDMASPAIRTAEPPVRHGDLLAWAASAPALAAPIPPAPRTLLLPAADDGVTATVRAVLGFLAADGSVVLCTPAFAAELGRDPARRAHLVQTERVTVD